MSDKISDLRYALIPPQITGTGNASRCMSQYVASESSVEQLKTSEVIGRAIMAAHNLEYWLERQPWPIDADLSDESSDESDSGIDEEAEVNPSPPHAIPRVVSSKPSPTQSSPTH